MLEKLFKISIIVIACFLIVLSATLVTSNLNLNAQLKSNTASNTYCTAVPESHVWEIVTVQSNVAAYLFNKVTGETYYLYYGAEPKKIK